MKKTILIMAIFIFITNYLFSQDQAGTESRLNNRPFRIGFYAQPLGFVQFGPIVGTEMTIANHLILEGHLRVASLGLLSYVVARDENDGLPNKLSGMAFGGAVKFMAPSKIGGFYIGPVIEYGSQNQTFLQSSSDAWESKATYVVFMLTTGYKFRFPSGFYINTGMYLGAYHTLTDHWHHIKYSTNIYKNNDLKTMPDAMLEVGLGFEF